MKVPTLLQFTLCKANPIPLSDVIVSVHFLYDIQPLYKVLSTSSAPFDFNISIRTKLAFLSRQ
jgi:hypothetical protein